MGLLRDAAGDVVSRVAERVGAGPHPSTEAPDPLAVPRLRAKHVLVVGILLLVAVIGAVLLFVNQQPTELTPNPIAHATVVATGTPPATRGSPSPSPGKLLVHVAGKVREPGVVQLPTGARVIDAVDAAGGALPGADLSGLNLARPLTDGEQVLVGLPPPPGGPSARPSPTGQALVDLNTATLEQLDALPGVGPVLAQRILDYRDEHGRFESVEDLQQVTGIGSRKFAELRELVQVS
ncbi:ComEA family DNA-binding protein [Tenggerimyces flavus]|uniref:ComEA family DNA-binding protein n=1 Tax=Tenggerimyces flavus TaxID=1708749 RepID=A0ABV7YID4_9ACTN|nr:ComEA family DNA-binding protein [Tenggerimyces flavus]MBM7789290.1 competence protein ComEA [Tenggerimyces flavus]